MASIDAAELARLPDWHHSVERGGLLRRSFRFPDFSHAFAFMTEVARHAEQHDHHPEWFNVYHRVDVVLTTHDAGGLTAKDLALARCMDEAAARHGVLTGVGP